MGYSAPAYGTLQVRGGSSAIIYSITVTGQRLGVSVSPASLIQCDEGLRA